MASAYYFLLCSERSGSNFITQMLNSHPEVCGPPPTHLLRAFSQNILNYGDLQKQENWTILTKDIKAYLDAQLGRWETLVTADELQVSTTEKKLSNLIKYIYSKEAKANGKDHVFIKENQIYRFIPYLLTAFPSAKFIYVVRDPRDMVLSWKKSDNHPGGVRKGAQVWKKDQEEFLRLYGYLKENSKILLVKYEDLVADSENELRKITNFLSFPYSPEMINFHKNKQTLENADRIKNWENLSKPVMKTNFKKYLNELSENEIRYIEAYCRKEMELLKYTPDFLQTEGVDELASKVHDTKTSESRTTSLTQDEIQIRDQRLKAIKTILERKLYNE